LVGLTKSTQLLRPESALQSAAVTQSVEDPVANEDKRYHREKRDDINESSALEIFSVAAHRRVQPMRLDFLRSISR
jgi:hypothetical protein